MTDASADGGPTGPTESPPPSGPVVVALGASAGGLAALKQFFDTVPEDSGLAFVVVVHLAAEHESYLASLLQPHAPIPVGQVTEETLIEPNRAYVIPPGRYLSAVDSHLRLAPIGARGADRAPIDYFFRTLAETHDGASVGVILTGTGSDGAHGITYIRERGGLTIVQDPDEAEFDGMPRSAIETGFVDDVLPIDAMVPRIREFAAIRPLLPTGEMGEKIASSVDREWSESLQNALSVVRVRTGHDFLQYKRSTLTRRIARRMQVLNLVRLGDYVERLRTDENEVGALIDDLLINVTNFFRDAAVFSLLASQVIPELFDGKKRGDLLRVWSVGCATGEEAYSLAMLLLEEAERHQHPPQIQVFATDLHERSIVKAREALYSEAIEAEVSPERLERFFRKELGGYRVSKALRDIVVFAAHNLLHDPPFSRLDLIVCRNVLIYLQRDVQADVIDLFHYALVPGGQLLLGTAETLDRSELFRVESKESHLYRRRDVARGVARLPAFALAPTLPRARPATNDAQAPAGVQPDTSYAAAHLRMVERHASPSLLVGPGHAVVHFSDGVGRFLEHPSGHPTHDLFKLVREEFRMELRTALHMARERRGLWRSRPIITAFDGERHAFVLQVRPASEPELDGFVLVVFEEIRDVGPVPDVAPDVDASVRSLEADLENTRSRMQALIEEFETSQEEMRASNEELQSANEELRSTLEELETSREELQSVNEELQTLNQENRHKVEGLSQLSSDLQNLLLSVDIATIFLDRNLRILRYTPRVSEIFNVRHIDRGRPLADLTHRLGYPGLIDDAKKVLQTLVPADREVEAAETGVSYQLRCAPYRTVDDRIEGVVITMVDVTALKRAQTALRSSQERQSLLVRLYDAMRPISDAVEMQRVAGRLLGEHLGATRVMYADLEDGNAFGRGGHAHGDPEFPAEAPLPEFSESFRSMYLRGDNLVVTDVRNDTRLTSAQRALYESSSVGAFAAVMLERRGRWVAGLTVHSAVPRQWTAEEVALIRAVVERVAVAADRARALGVLRLSEEQYRHIVEGARDYAIFTTDLEGKIVSWSPGAQAVLGWSADEAIGKSLNMIYTPEDRDQAVPEAERAQAVATGYAPDERWHMRKDGTRVFIDGSARALTDGFGEVTKILKIGQDVTDRRRMEKALHDLNQSLELRVRERTDQLEAANRAARERDAAFRLRLTQAEEAERGRLARDLHDEAGQLLTALGLGLKALLDGVPVDSKLTHHTDKLRELADSLGRELHAVATRLRPRALDDFGLEPALHAYADEWMRVSGIELSVHAPTAASRLPESIETAIYRIVQEALTNVARHSHAKRASVLVERRDGEVVAVVEDNGRGLDPAALDDGSNGDGLGLRGIRERAGLLGGTAEIESTDGTGTTVFVRIPVVGGG